LLAAVLAGTCATVQPSALIAEKCKIAGESFFKLAPGESAVNNRYDDNKKTIQAPSKILAKHQKRVLAKDYFIGRLREIIGHCFHNCQCGSRPHPDRTMCAFESRFLLQLKIERGHATSLGGGSSRDCFKDLPTRWQSMHNSFGVELCQGSLVLGVIS
jgi:hypothetical protein